MNTSDVRMRGMHGRFIDLAAAAIDFGLTSAEQAELEGHLASCPACDRWAGAVRADALALGRPLTVAPSRRVDDAVHAEIARPGAGPSRLILALAAALLVVAVLGVLAVGAYLLREPAPLLTTVLPAPTATPIATAVSPTPAATTTATETARPDPVLLPSESLPLDAQILFALGDGQTQRSITTGTLGGSAVREIALGQDPSFLWDADQIVFACTDQGSTLEVVGICYARLTQSGVSRVLDDPTARDPRMQPGLVGAQITYNRGTIDVGEAWIADKDGSSARMLAAGGAPAWSADGLWLAYQPEGATFQVAVIRSDGSGQRVVGGGYDPAWSRVGARLLFAVLDGSDGSLVVVAADAPAGANDVVFEAASPLFHPSWLDEDRIVFWMGGDVWRLDMGTTERVRLTTDLGIAEGAPLSVSPDGRWLLFASPTLPTAQMYVVSIDGGWAPAGIAPGTLTNPIWRPEPAQSP